MDNNLLNGLNDKDAEIEKIRSEILNKREQEFSKVIEEYVAHRLMMVELEKQAKSSEEKIRRALKAKITRISNLEKAIKEFESKSESEITPEAREKYEKNLREYDRKKNPQNYKARKRTRKTQAVILEETKQKIAEMRETIKADEEKIHLYTSGKSNEDVLLSELNGNYRTGHGIDGKENQPKDTREEGEKAEGKRDEREKEEQHSESDDIEEKLGKLFSSGVFGTKPEENKTDLLPFKSSEKRHEELVTKFKNAIEIARKRGFNSEEIKQFILTGNTEGMSFMEVRKLEFIAGLRDGYEGDKQQLIKELFEEDEEDKFTSFKYKHPKIAAIPVIGRLIAKIADRREKRKIRKATEVAENQEYISESTEKEESMTQERRKNFIESLKTPEYSATSVAHQMENKSMPEVERI